MGEARKDGGFIPVHIALLVAVTDDGIGKGLPTIRPKEAGAKHMVPVVGIGQVI